MCDAWSRNLGRSLLGLKGAALDFQSVFTSKGGGKPALEQIAVPFFSVPKSDAIIRVLPSPLCFWDKLVLSPRAGEKNVCAFVFFQSDDARVDIQVASVGNFDAHGR